MAIEPYKQRAPSDDSNVQFAKVLEGSPLLGAVPLSIPCPTATGLTLYRHGLGRVYQGVILVGQTFATPPYTVVRPQDIDDPTTFFGITAISTTSDGAMIDVLVY